MEDTTEVTIRYYLEVTDDGPYPSQVKELMFGKAKRGNPHPSSTPYSTSVLEKDKEWLLTTAAQVLTLKAKAAVGKAIIIESPIPGVKKGGDVADKGEVRNNYTMTVNSWGSSSNRAKELVFGNAISGNLQINPPIELTYVESEKDKMFSLAKKLLDLGASVSIDKKTVIDVPFN